jgi:L-fucose dehydrogenase
MDLQLKDKIITVTGGAKGMGAAITRGFAAEGAILCIFGRNAEETDARMASIAADGGRVSGFHGELTDSASLSTMGGHGQAKFGRIDAIINHAAGNDSVTLDSGLDAFRTSLKRNLIHVFDLVHQSHEALRQSQGTIINIDRNATTISHD